MLIFGLSHFYLRAENWLGVTTETYLVIFWISDLAIFVDVRSLWSLPYGTLCYLFGKLGPIYPWAVFLPQFFYNNTHFYVGGISLILYTIFCSHISTQIANRISPTHLHNFCVQYLNDSKKQITNLVHINSFVFFTIMVPFLAHFLFLSRSPLRYIMARNEI